MKHLNLFLKLLTFSIILIDNAIIVRADNLKHGSRNPNEVVTSSSPIFISNLRRKPHFPIKDPSSEPTQDDLDDGKPMERKTQELSKEMGGERKRKQQEAGRDSIGEEKLAKAWQYLSGSNAKQNYDALNLVEAGDRRHFGISLDDKNNLNGRNRNEGGIVGFSLVRASNESRIGIKGTIRMDNVFTDLNGAWDKEASMFKAKESGLYFFSFNARGRTNSSRDATWLVSLMLNGVDVISIGGANDTSSSNTILLPLNPSDEVWLQLRKGFLVESEDKGQTGLTSFSGYRIGSISRNDIVSTNNKDRPNPYQRHKEILEERERELQDLKRKYHQLLRQQQENEIYELHFLNSGNRKDIRFPANAFKNNLAKWNKYSSNRFSNRLGYADSQEKYWREKFHRCQDSLREREEQTRGKEIWPTQSSQRSKSRPYYPTSERPRIGGRNEFTSLLSASSARTREPSSRFPSRRPDIEEQRKGSRF